jgi:hypothetical protein
MVVIQREGTVTERRFNMPFCLGYRVIRNTSPEHLKLFTLSACTAFIMIFCRALACLKTLLPTYGSTDRLNTYGGSVNELRQFKVV